MQHVTEEQLVSHYYHDADAASVGEHLRGCTECRTQYATLQRVLELVDEAPVPERGEEYGEQVWRRLRWKLGSERRRRATWISSIAVAAALALAFFAGLFWRGRNEITPTVTATQAAKTAMPAAETGRRTTEQGENRVLLVVVGDHLDSTERMLMEVSNADPQRTLSFGDESRRATELVASNRIYRQAAVKRGDERIAQLLAEIEPVLIEMSHAGDSMSTDDLAALQKRIDSKGLLFKVRIISAQVSGREQAPHATNADTL